MGELVGLGTRGEQVGLRWAAIVTMSVLLVVTSVSTGEAKGRDPGKIDPALLALATANPTRDFAVIVRAALTKTKGDHAAKRAKAAIDRAKGKFGHSLSIAGGASATLNGAAVLALTKDKDVGFVSQDHVLTAKFDPAQGAGTLTTPGLVGIGVPDAWTQYGAIGRGIGVAVIDSGIAPSPDLAGRIVASVDFTTGAPGEPLVAPADPGGHGTHVAGLIGGDGTASAGAYTGVAPGANLVDVRVIGAGGATTVSTLLRGMQWVLANKATYNIRVANMSLGAAATLSYRNDPLATAAEVLTFAGIAVVVSAGNSGPGETTVTTPGYDPFVITVGALDDNGTPALDDDSLASWSSRGPTAPDGIAKPDLVAPGRKMVSLRSPGSTLDQMYPDRQVAGTDLLAPAYFRMSGTSMAAPVVAGTIALMLERNPSLRPAQLKHRLMGTATPLAFGSPNTTGNGLLNVSAAVGSADSASFVPTNPVSDGFATEMYALLVGQAIAWRDPSYNGGVDSNGVLWSDITWDTIAWNEITWENLSWDAFSWAGITWEEVTWEEITWETTSQNVNILGGARGWVLVN